MARVRAYLATVIVFAFAVHLVENDIDPLLPYVVGGLVAMTVLGLLYYRRKRW